MIALLLQVVSVQPRSGYLQPNTAIMCRFTFKPCSSPTVYDINLSCQVKCYNSSENWFNFVIQLVDETEKAMYKQKLKEWEKKIAELKQSFTISESFTSRGSKVSAWCCISPVDDWCIIAAAQYCSIYLSKAIQSDTSLIWAMEETVRCPNIL